VQAVRQRLGHWRRARHRCFPTRMPSQGSNPAPSAISG
jgi:hypothetical protein